MLTDPIRAAFSSMCYREIRPGVWAKPVGASLFTFSVEKGWENWFKGLDGTPRVYERHGVTFDGTDDPVEFLHFLKQYEAWTRINIATESDHHFELQPQE